MLGAACLTASPAKAQWMTFVSPLDPCIGDCSATLFTGRLVKTAMWEILVTKHQMPWDWQWGGSYFVGGALNREIIKFDRFAAIEIEGGAGKRFGSLDEGEFWGALYLRWKWFPWNDYLRTTVAISTGLNWATDLPPFERVRTGSGQQLLHYLAPEFTLGLPSEPNWDLVFRLHHRSGGHFKFFNNSGGGVQYGTAGLRYKF